MRALQNIKKDQGIELAWKELREAIKPFPKPLKSSANNDKKAVLSHPALITTSEFFKWELFS